MKKTLLGILSLTLLFACSKKKSNDDVVPAPSSPFVYYRHILYGTDTVQQVMDLYLPNQRSMENTPVFILLHGGAWVQGDITDFNGTDVDTFLTANGCALIIMNYRLDGSYKYPAPVDDIDSVMSYIERKAGEWNINADRVCLFGRSSGSQLALMYAYSRNKQNRVKAVIDGFGPSNFIDSSVVDAPLGINVTVMLGPYASNKQAWHDASPIFYMSGAVPTLIYQGSVDQLVLPIQSEMLEDSLVARGIPSMYISWNDDGHGWNEQRWDQWKEVTLQWVRRFL